MKLLLVLALTLAVTLANALPTKSGPQGRITFGYLSDNTQFNYQVGLARGEERRLLCGASIIAETWVLTAAHCVYGFYDLYLHLGNFDFTKPRLSIKVAYEDVIIHQGYDPRNLNNDIALIRTSTKIPISDNPKSYYGKVTLPAKGTHDSYLHQLVTASGWGQTENMPWDLNYIRYGRMQVISNEKCLEIFNNVDDKKLCTSSPYRISTCSGDSGGPLVLEGQRKQIGITSFVAIAGCTLNKPAGFVRVSEYLDWIQHFTGVFYE